MIDSFPIPIPIPIPLSPSVISLKNVGKRYALLTAEGNAFTRLVMSRLHRHINEEDFWALRGIDLEIPAGAMVGLIGANGSGKSTLLKLIAGITPPTEGSVEVRGRVVAMLEVGLGFHPDLTGYENIYLHGALLGLSREEIGAQVPNIVAYSELGELMELPLKHFSTGMHSRLGFAVAVHSDPDIVLVDEMLAVGDGRFQVKCIETMRQFHAQGKTIILVSHNIRHARTLCDHIVWLDHGRPVAQGPAEEITTLYLRSLAHEVLGEVHEDRDALGTADENRRADIQEVTVTDAEGRSREEFNFGETLLITVRGVANAPILEPDLRFTLVREDYEIVGVESARGHGLTQPVLEAGPFTWTIRWPNIFLNSFAYDLGVTLLSGGHALARRSRAARFRVKATHMLDARQLADLPCAFDVRTR